MKKIIISKSVFLSLILCSNMFASSGLSQEAKNAAKEIEFVSKKAEEAKMNQQNVRPKTEAQLELEAEKEAKKVDKQKRLNLNIYALRKMLSNIPKHYDIADVDIATVGSVSYYVYETELKRSIKDLIQKKELRKEIGTFLKVVNSSKKITSKWALNEQYSKLTQKYNTWMKKSTRENATFEYTTGRRIPINEGLVSNGIYAKRIHNYIRLYYK